MTTHKLVDLVALSNRLSTRLNNHLCEMKPHYDDSISGFNEAWDIVRQLFAEVAHFADVYDTGELDSRVIIMHCAGKNYTDVRELRVADVRAARDLRASLTKEDGRG